MLSFIPGLGTATATAQVGATVAKDVVGEEKYEEVKSTATLWSGFQAGLIPLTPLLPLQIALFIFFIIMFLAFDFGGLKATVGAYLAQAVIIAFIWQWAADKFLRYGVGV